MIKEIFQNYQILSEPTLEPSGKWSVSIEIRKEMEGSQSSQLFHANDNIHYILKEEAAKEGLNLGRNLIKRNLVGF